MKLKNRRKKEKEKKKKKKKKKKTFFFLKVSPPSLLFFPPVGFDGDPARPVPKDGPGERTGLEETFPKGLLREKRMR